MVQHNMMVEDLAKQKYLLEMKREEREKHKSELEAWKGKSQELDYKMNLLKRYKEFRDEYGWNDDQIIAFCPG